MMTRIISARSPRAKPGLALVLSLLLGNACQSPEVERVIELSEAVPFQSRQVLVDRIDPASNSGLDRLGAGWEVTEDPEGPGYLVARGSRSVFDFFALSAGLGDLVFVFRDGESPSSFRVELNGRSQGPSTPNGGELRLEGLRIAEGWNRVELFREDPSKTVHLERIVLPVPALPEAPGRASITTRQTASPPRTIVEMPGGSRLELVAELPERAVWEGRYRAQGPGTVRAELQLEDGELRELLHSEEPEGGFRVELADRAGELAELRLVVDGPPSSRVHWSETRLHGRGAAPARPPETEAGLLGRPDIYVILIDAARADAFGCYGGPWSTPFVDGLADDGTRFARAWAPSSWTGQSVPSLLTGQTPDQLGIETWGDHIPPEASTLAEGVREIGYRTLLWSHHPLYRTHRSHARGFEQVIGSRRRDVVPTTELLIAGAEPVFAWIHLLPPHGPYRPPPEFLNRYAQGELDDPRLEPEFLTTFPSLRPPEELAPEDLDFIRNRYGEMASFADDLVGQILTSLREAGRYRDALVVLISDHGEGFLEHGRFQHTSTLHREMLEVPWIIKWPEQLRGHRPVVEDPVSLLDLAPTLATGLGLDPSRFGARGPGLWPVIFDRASPSEPLFAYTHGVSRRRHRPRPSVAVELDGWKAILRETDGQLLLFNTTDDPLESQNLAPMQPLRARWLRQLARLRRNAHTRASSSEGDLDAEVSKELEALGYL